MSTDLVQLKGWSLDLARKWNSGSYSVFIIDGNIFDAFPVQYEQKVLYLSLKAFLSKRLFSNRAFLLFYDISDGLTFATKEMQGKFFSWLETYDKVEGTDYHAQGLPREFTKLTPILRRFFGMVKDELKDEGGITLAIDFPEKLVPASEESGLNNDERTALVTLLKWASSSEIRDTDINVFLITESAADLNRDLLSNPHIAQVRVELPDEDDRRAFLESSWLDEALGERKLSKSSDISIPILATRTAGLNFVRILNLITEAVFNGERLTNEHLTKCKKRLIEEFCQGLVSFKEPIPGISLDNVATHTAAKKKLRELAWLIKNGKKDVLEKGILLPGRVGVGKSFLVDCFASECGLPVMVLGNFRSKWVGDTEGQLAKILMTIKALGPVIVVIDEADAALGSRESSGDSGVSSRVFTTIAAHIGDASLRGRELWIAMTSRPDLLSIDMKRQGRFGLCIPLFPAQCAADVMDLFTTVAKTNKLSLSDEVKAYVSTQLGDRPLTGSDVESIIIRAKEAAVLAKRDSNVTKNDFEESVNSFIDPLDRDLLTLQELSAVLACSDRRYLPDRFSSQKREDLEYAFKLCQHKITLLR